MVAIKAHFYFYIMAKQKELNIKTVPVEIKVLTVDGKRMTKSVFTQILQYDNGDGVLFELKEGKLNIIATPLGWVNLPDGDWLILNSMGILCKIRKTKISFSESKFPGYVGRPQSAISSSIHSNNFGLSFEENGSTFRHVTKFKTIDEYRRDVYPRTGYDISGYYEKDKKDWYALWDEMKEFNDKFDAIKSSFSEIDNLFAPNMQIFISI